VSDAPSSEAGELIRALGLEPHPEGGHFAETWRGSERPRAAGTAIYFLLRAGERAHWHRIDATEIWHFHRGAPLVLEIAAAGAPRRTVTLGPSVERGQVPQAIVPAHAWQAAASLGDYTLVGCTVSPGFDFAGFELAPEGFAP
jgi:predicted cupin superfamily sugar epimerase